ncbi:MAG: rubrerythrin family protein [Planctomycetota bacterium]|nr:rubrerythrin family protein [Planctomycetota bacterium]
MDLKGSVTEKNLMAAFAGESQARNRYTYFSAVAKKEGYEQVSRLFQETADQEKEHAKRLFKFMPGGEAQITATFPFGAIGKTEANLRASAGGENYEWTQMYPDFAKAARGEGFEDIAKVLDAIAVAERFHEKRYLSLAGSLAAGTVFKKAAPVVWICHNCGYLHTGEEAPRVCPACTHPQGHFHVLAETW